MKLKCVQILDEEVYVSICPKDLRKIKNPLLSKRCLQNQKKMFFRIICGKFVHDSSIIRVFYFFSSSDSFEKKRAIYLHSLKHTHQGECHQLAGETGLAAGRYCHCVSNNEQLVKTIYMCLLKETSDYWFFDMYFSCRNPKMCKNVLLFIIISLRFGVEMKGNIIWLEVKSCFQKWIFVFGVFKIWRVTKKVYLTKRYSWKCITARKRVLLYLSFP